MVLSCLFWNLGPRETPSFFFEATAEKVLGNLCWIVEIMDVSVACNVF